MALTFGNKIENNGETAQGRLTAAEFNTLVDAVNQNESDINRIGQNYTMTSGLSLEYDNIQRVIVLSYTKSGVTTTLATVNADNFVIGGSLTSASYETEDGEGNSGEFLKLEFSTEQTVYINLTPIVGAALTLINSRLSALEGTNVFLTEAQYGALLEKDPDKLYFTSEGEEGGESGGESGGEGGEGGESCEGGEGGENGNGEGE